MFISKQNFTKNVLVGLQKQKSSQNPKPRGRFTQAVESRRPDTNRVRRGLFIQEGRGPQVRTIKGRADNDAQVKVMPANKEGERQQEVNFREDKGRRDY